MSNEKAQAIAEKIEARAADALSGLDREMTIMKWPAEFRAIMWEAVAQEAMSRANDARAQRSRSATKPNEPP